MNTLNWQTWPADLFSLATLRQVIAFLVVLVLALLLRQLGVRLVQAQGQRRFAQLAWVRQFFTVLKSALLPFLVLVLAQLAVEIFQMAGWNSLFLTTWINPLAELWLLYAVLATILVLTLPPGPAHFWSRQVLLPALLVVWLLTGLELLDDVLAWGVTLGQGPRITVNSVLIWLAIVAVFFAVSKGIRQFLERVFLPRTGAEPALAHALSTLATYAVILAGVVLAFSAAGFELTTLAVIAGGLSVGLGLGLQDVINNLVSGFILTFERSIAPGDMIEIGGTRGVVQNIGVRSMVVRTSDNIELIIPNSHFLKETMTNLTHNDLRIRLRIPVSVSYHANPREAEQALLEAARHPLMLDEPGPSVLFKGFGTNTLDFELLVWTEEPDRIPALTSDLRYSIWDALDSHNIDLPFPAPPPPAQSRPVPAPDDNSAKPA